MIRLTAIAVLLILPAALAGCGGDESIDSTDPGKLPALSGEERALMTQHDTEVADAEKSQLLVTPEVKEKRAKAKRVNPDSATAERF